MAGTKWARYALEELQERFPDLRAGICNCRRISGSSVWSQHADCNALDLYHVDYGYSLAPAHQAFLDEVHAFIRTHFDDLSIRTLIWRKRDHFNHIHIDPYPKRYGTPSCAGATTSRWQYPDGSIVTLGKYQSPDPLAGYPELPDKPIEEVDHMNQTIARGDRGFEVAYAQQKLIDLEYDLGNWNPYDEETPAWFTGTFSPGADGVAGAAFEQAVSKFQGDNSLKVNGVLDGVTLAFLFEAAGGPPADVLDHDHDDEYAAKDHGHNVATTGKTV